VRCCAVWRFGGQGIDWLTKGFPEAEYLVELPGRHADFGGIRVPGLARRAGTPFARRAASLAMFFANHFFEPVPAYLAPPPGTLWTLIHETEGSVSVNVGAHPHGYELRLVLNQRFLRSRVHESLTGVLADATDTRTRFELLGFCEVETSLVH
jgi:hypothetical protein